MTASKDEPMTATLTMEEIGGRTLRVARWRVDAESGGRATGHPPILFFNGIGANIEAVAPLAEALTERGFIMFDMPGVGESPEPVLPYNPFTMSWTAKRLLDHFGIDEVDVMGISWGGAMAQHFTLQHPRTVRRLVLVATTAGMVMIPGNPAALTKMANPRRYIDPEFMNEHFMTLYGGMTKRAGEKAKHIGRLKPPTPRGYLYQLIAMMGWTSVPALPFLNKETLVMMGDEDQVVPLVNGKLLAKLIPNARLEIFEGGGHLFLLTHADESIAAIRAFLDEGDTKAELNRAA